MSNVYRSFEHSGFRRHRQACRHHDAPSFSKSSAQLAGEASITDCVWDSVEFVKTLDMAPILIGHSLGGVVAKTLAAMGLAHARVLLNGSVIWGILPATDPERPLGRTLMASGPFWKGTLLPDFETMAESGLNKLESTEQHRLFNRLGPESGRVLSNSDDI